MFFKNQRIGKYEVLETIGTGGFGSVYLARDVLIDKRVAIKVPHKQGEEQEKLLREPRLLAALNHPNIVTVITAEQINHIFFIVMEYVDGQSLEKYLREFGKLSLAEALPWFIKIAEALTYAHGKGIIHRDIRPANVLISKESQVKVADLGTSRYLLESPHASTRIGSPPYMAPEHFQGKATYQSDVYALGVLMYESLSGRLPYYDKSPRKLAQLVNEGRAEPVHRFNKEVPTMLSKVITQAMHRNLDVRHHSAQSLLEDLRRIHLHYQVGTSQELSHLIEDFPKEVEPDEPAIPNGVKRNDGRAVFFPKELATREISSLFCWNCSRPIQKRTQSCPHCSVSLT